MTDVSEAEVEAAAIAIYKCEYHFPNWDGPTLAESTRKQYRDSARAALTAAAQVRQKQSEDPVVTAYQESLARSLNEKIAESGNKFIDGLSE